MGRPPVLCMKQLHACRPVGVYFITNIPGSPLLLVLPSLYSSCLQALVLHLAGLTPPWHCCCVQVHLFIFFMAIIHILGGILLIVLAALRIRVWRRWAEHSDHVALE